MNLIFGENEKYVNDFIGDSIVKQTAKQLQKHTTDWQGLQGHDPREGQYLQYWSIIAINMA